jgi:PrcB C-terminal
MQITNTFILSLIISGSLGIACLSSCSAEKEIIPEIILEQEQISIQHGFDSVWKGALFGGGEEGIEKHNVCIRNQEEWDALKLRIDSQNNVSKNFKEEGLNFESGMLIVCFDKVRPNGGYSIEIESVTEVNESINVKVVSTAPTGPATSVLTQPFHIIWLVVLEKPVKFNP